MRTIPAALVAAAALAIAPAASAPAATFTPSTTSDGGAGSLRAAITDANADGVADDIVLGAAAYQLTLSGSDNTNAAGDFDVTSPITIAGAGAGVTSIEANDVDRLFHVLNGGNLVLRDLTVTDGDDFGGAMFIDGNPAHGTIERVTVRQFDAFSAMLGQGSGTMTVRDSLFEDNDGTFAGGVFSQGTIVTTIADTTFRGNDVGFGGGGVFSQQDAKVTITGSLFDDNFADFGGAGLWAQGNSVTTVTDSVFAGNESDFGGGALWTQDTADVTVERSLFDGNFTTPDAIGGGAIWTQADSKLTVRDTTIRDNTALTSSGGGGGLYAQADSDVTLERTTLSGNRMQAVAGSSGDLRGGGAAFISGSASLALLNSTVDGNRSDVAGGGILLNSDGTLDMTHTTLSGNTATTVGGPIANFTNPAATSDVVARWENSIIAGNSPQACSQGTDAGTIESEGRNVEDGSTCGSAMASDVRNADAKLGPLQDNGGPTATRALLVDSPARDLVPTPLCVPVDQRGIARPLGAACDSGAFEATPPPVAAPVVQPVVTPPPAPLIVPPPPRPVAVRLASLKASQVLRLPSTRRCVSRRRFRIRLRTPRGASITRVVVKVNRKTVRTVRGRRITAPVDLRGLPKGRFTVSIQITTADGRRVTGTRRYRTCTPKRRSRRAG